VKRLLAIGLCLMIYCVSVSPAFACRRHRTSNARHAYAGQSRYRRVGRTYYSYAPRRSFWQRHRDKLTLAMGTAGGMGVGALIGGRRGAGIGALAGFGSSALYTYKLRNRRRY
jgi:hypothetical protein